MLLSLSQILKAFHIPINTFDRDPWKKFPNALLYQQHRGSKLLLVRPCVFKFYLKFTLLKIIVTNDKSIITLGNSIGNQSIED